MAARAGDPVEVARDLVVLNSTDPSSVYVAVWARTNGGEVTKRTNVLHLGPANYCRFTDPSRAFRLKLADTPTAARPLVGLCDSAAARRPPTTLPPASLGRTLRTH